MLEELKRRVYEQNLALVEHGLVILTWGNVSAIDRKSGLVVIKPSGVAYSKMRVEDMVVVNLDGQIMEGSYQPSSDLATHLEIYKAFPSVGGIVHTHSTYATAWAQSGRNIPVYGTTHADAFYGNIPCTRDLKDNEIQNEYEKNTGLVICEVFQNKDILSIPAILVKSHGPFTWGETCEKAVQNAVVLETVSKQALLTELLNSKVSSINQNLLDKHYFRKHGENSYYGQKNKNNKGNF